jgi:hypothetical protein
MENKQPKINKKRIIRSIRNVSISVGVLIVLLVAAGAIYTWFAGRNPAPNQTTNAVDATPAPVVKAVDPAPNAPESASVQSLTSPVAPGDNASATIKTNPGSWCTITVVYDKTASTDSGLTGKTADDFGSVSWTWTVDTTAPTGTWPVTVTCLRNKVSAVVVGSLIVAKA